MPFLFFSFPNPLWTKKITNKKLMIMLFLASVDGHVCFVVFIFLQSVKHNNRDKGDKKKGKSIVWLSS